MSLQIGSLMAKECAAQSGDLPRLSDVDLDVLALALGLNIPLVTDDYRLQNTMKAAGKQTTSVGTIGAKTSLEMGIAVHWMPCFY